MAYSDKQRKLEADKINSEMGLYDSKKIFDKKIKVYKVESKKNAVLQ